jgi:hypothetical protein
VADINRMRVDVTGVVSGDVLAYDGVDAWLPVAAGGGSDPWTTVKLASDFASSVTFATPLAITGWSFTPAANKTYMIEAWALAYAASTAIGIRPGYAAMTGDIECGIYLSVPNGAAGTFIRHLYGTSVQNSASTASVSATPHLIYMQGILISGAAPTSDFQFTLSTESAASDVTFIAGSFFRYREV